MCVFCILKEKSVWYVHDIAVARKEFDFLTADQLQAFDFMSVPHDEPEGYILEVAIGYPKEIHDEHNDYPLCPESSVIERKRTVTF